MIYEKWLAALRVASPRGNALPYSYRSYSLPDGGCKLFRKIGQDQGHLLELSHALEGFLLLFRQYYCCDQETLMLGILKCFYFVSINLV